MKCYVLYFTLIVLTIGFSHCYNETNLKSKCGLQENSISVGDYPWVAYITLSARTYPGGTHKCMGALINERYVITSSICLMHAMKHVNIGGHQIGVERWVVHDGANVALLKLEKDVEFSDTVLPICLPFDEFKTTEKDNTFYVAGWGASSAEPKIMHNKKIDCNDDNTENKACFEQIDKSRVCRDDQGAPVMYKTDEKWILNGFLSSPYNIDDCAQNQSSIAVKITDDLLKWIVKVIET
ncbi:hypothetical protein FQR65_LT07036 [Abscondita terminalis]|nr:hypothetical protein FQR65_LT07036 [Abscondita terminalis]